MDQEQIQAEQQQESMQVEGQQGPQVADAPEGQPQEVEATLITTDWAQEWIDIQASRRHADNSSFWDERSKTFPTSKGPKSTYVSTFMRLADVQPGETIFDMGCGTGALATPFAREGHPVIACDFSAGMLAKMTANQAELGVTGVKTIQMSWQDDWEEHGVMPDSADVAFASRSIVTNDLRQSLMKLNTVARRRCCITLPTGSSPRTDSEILRALGLKPRLGRDYIYAFNILTQCGIYPEVHYIPTSRYDSYASYDEAFDNLAAVVKDACTYGGPTNYYDEAMARLHSWLDENLIPNEHMGELDHHGNPEKEFRLKQERNITWAFIAWNK